MGKDHVGEREIAKILRADSDDIKFLLINYELTWRYKAWLKRLRWDGIIVDESHRMKKPTSRQSKALNSVGRDCPWKLILTGTPIGNDDIDLYSQVRFLNDSIFPKWSVFKKKWCRPAGYGGFKNKILKGKLPTFLKRVDELAFRVKAREVFDLPPVSDEAIYVPLTGKAKRHYHEMERDFYTKYGEYETTTDMMVTNMLRLQQICGGYLPTDEEDVVVELNQDKLLAIGDYLEDVPRDKKIVVFARFTLEIDSLKQLMKKQGRSCAVIEGGMKQKDIDKAWMDFQDKDDPVAIILQIQAGGVSIDLFRSCLCFFYSRSYSYIDYDQARKRVDRNGQKNPVRFISMIVKNSIDEDIDFILDSKGSNADLILNQLKKRLETNG